LATIDLSTFKPVVGTDSDANLIRNAFDAIQTGVNGIDNNNVAGAAAIAYSKLNLSGSIVNADINAAAAIGIAKLAGYPTDATKFLRGDATWAVPASTRTLTGIIPASGTTATAGTGFTYTHTNASGIYVFTITSSFPAAPVVVAMLQQFTGGQAADAVVLSVTSSGFTVETRNSLSLSDMAFNFLVYQVA
jgi:hypothetical protein